MRKSALLLLFLLSVPLTAQTVEERLARLEQEVRELRAENQELRQRLDTAAPSVPAAAPAPAPAPATTPVPVTAGSTESSLLLGGLIHAQGESGDAIDSRYSGANDRLYLRRARIHVIGNYTKQFDFKVEADLAGSLSSGSNLRAQLVDGYLTWMPHTSANVRFGQFKAPFGYELLVSDPVLLTPERSLVTDRLAPARQLGIQLSGALPYRSTYAVGAYNGLGVNTNANDNDSFLLAARLASTLLETKLGDSDVRLSGGVNAFQSDDAGAPFAPDLRFTLNAFHGERTAWGADAQMTVGRALFGAEYLSETFEPLDEVPLRKFDATGWYAHGVWNFIPLRLQGVVRYEAFDPNDRLRADDTGVWVIGTNYMIKGNDLKLQFYYYMNDKDENRFVARLQTAF